ncbi:MAG: nucleotide exchange factor GrpE [Thermoplasmata archaeon]|nr:nucleotide exchange factor GrpE [Thermoplasmata archaeon]
MAEEDEFEFDFDEEDEDDADSSGSAIKTVKARKIPISDGIKKRLLLNMREIKRFREEAKDLLHDNKNLESEIELIEDEIEKLRSEKEKMIEDLNRKVAIATAMEKKYDRTQKDFENYKKRVDKDIDRQSKMGAKKLVMGIIETLDNFERAINEIEKMEGVEDHDSILSGFRAIQKNLINNLRNNDVEMVDPTGEIFDPLYHEAIEMELDKDEYENTILKVESRGYLLDGVVLRPAKVIVSRGGPLPPKKKKKDGKKSNDEDGSKYAPSKNEDPGEEEMEELEEFE